MIVAGLGSGLDVSGVQVLEGCRVYFLGLDVQGLGFAQCGPKGQHTWRARVV